MKVVGVYFTVFFRGLSQYGLLHFGQTLGYSSLFRGTHSCPHRSHLYPLSIIFAKLRAPPWQEFPNAVKQTEYLQKTHRTGDI